ncbi:MAG TPA: hypothetical protein P5572_10190 [Phycisphaerae bacterium]|nr:hypothetical protein [Phycisphaerae bacterium]
MTIRQIAWVALVLAAAVPLTVHAAEDDAGGDEAASPVTLEHGPAGQVVLTLSAETQQRIGLAVTKLTAVTRTPRAQAYGMLEADPAHSFTLRAPVGGYLRSSDAGAWPEAGQQVTANQSVGTVQPRFTAAESFDLVSRWTEADAEVERVSADLDAARASYENKRKLNANGGLVSDRAVEEARALVKGDEANLAAAKKKAEIINGLLTGGAKGGEPFPLTVPLAGQVATVLASPDECVDSGQTLLSVVDRTHLIARVSLPAGTPAAAPDAAAQLSVLGAEERVLTGAALGPAAMRDPTMRGPTLLYRVAAPDAEPLQTGAPVIAYVPLASGEIHGVLIPRSAIVRLSGLTWVYVQTAPDTFERREVTLAAPETDAWLATAGADAGDVVVSSAAQLLLSEEQKGQIENEEAAAE